MPDHITDEQARRAARAALTENTAWAIRPESLAVIAGLAAGDLTLAEAREQVEAARGRRQTQVVRGGVALLQLTGLITPQGSFLSWLFGGSAGGLQGFRDDLHSALGDDEVGSILINVDSPGGLVDLVPETAAEVRAARTLKPVVAVANTMAASAAYWIACQADELMVTPSGEVGSIGVFTRHVDWSKMDAEAGITVTLVSAGKYKTERNPYEPLSREAKAAMQSEIDFVYDMFVADVAAGRGATESAVRTGYGEGRMARAGRAVDARLADGVETLDEAASRLATGSVKRRGGSSAEAAELLERIRAEAEEEDPIEPEDDPAPPAPEDDPDPPEPETDDDDPADDEPGDTSSGESEASLSPEDRGRLATVLLG